ncbi:hypothetical protein HPP92_018577 [Vanilla planifolia]|uniref:Small acidic protein-like domain-containing protein n=1 Tax=Vanilla planifolia TaxID=51239 RepID=A0A835QBD3_VANPL|nr:hypothetical protein HPP92_018577 [Vanilla planifolia]
MDIIPKKDSLDESDLKPSFRKPSNDATSRKYRRHSPVHGSDSSSSGSLTRESSRLTNTFEGRAKASDVRVKNYDGKGSEWPRNHSSRGSDPQRYPDKKAHQSFEGHRHSDYAVEYHRHSIEENRNSDRSSKSGREHRSGRSDYTKHDDGSECPKETSQNANRYHSRNKSENSGYSSKDKDKEANVSERHRYYEKESSRGASGTKQITSRRDDKQLDEWDEFRERDDRNDKRVRRRSPSDYKRDYGSAHEEFRGRQKESLIERESGSHGMKENQSKEFYEQNQIEKKGFNARENDKQKERHARNLEEDRIKETKDFHVYQSNDYNSESNAVKASGTVEGQNSLSKRSKLGQSAKFNTSRENPSLQDKERTADFTVGMCSSTNSNVEANQDLNAAKVAAMKAAELVNRNLVGGAYMSTDQKKKLLWGNKKNSSEESSNRWDLQLFADRERQEKFNKLMGVKGDAVPERKLDEKDVEKHKEMQTDLEKQYTAGLRRRDGRTVGLGL